MPNQEDKFWRDIARKLRQDLLLRPLSMKEAEEEYEAAESVELPDEKLDAIIEAAVAGEHAVWDNEPDPTAWTSELDTSEVESDVRQLNRNLSDEKDAEADELVEKHRRETFEEDDEEDDKEDDEEDGDNSSGAEDFSS